MFSLGNPVPGLIAMTFLPFPAVEADLAQSLSALGAAKPCAEAGPIVEDGRLQVAAFFGRRWKEGR